MLSWLDGCLLDGSIVNVKKARVIIFCRLTSAIKLSSDCKEREVHRMRTSTEQNCNPERCLGLMQHSALI